MRDEGLDDALGGADLGVPRDEPSDLALLAALPDHPEVLGDLYDRHADLVYGLAMAVLQNEADAEDLTHEVFVVLRTAHSYDPERGTLAAYLVSLTRARAIDRLRRRGRHLRLLRQWHDAEAPPSGAPAPHHTAVRRELSRRVRSALASLSEREREVLELSYYRGMTQTEIAEHLGAPLGSVKSWSRRGLLSLRDDLADLLQDEQT